ncbi:choline dehydrogenase [Lineolata rhizophorae]|uniref:Choline dehydrogenase n=1 Tax=Lineolata rhizophorae TaxID=578093 RepID=A0A6A6PEF2_9PEZI|nr:choline dehydrogenase [Lineolata rhizophorae]
MGKLNYHLAAVFALFFSLFELSNSLPYHSWSAQIKRQTSELLDSYDYIIVGGGTAGLTVADRLSESGEDNVLVIEYGYLDNSPAILNTGPNAFGFDSSSASRFYNISSVPQKNLNNRTVSVTIGCVVGGSSAVNGMYFDRGSAEDYDAISWAAGEDFDTWAFEGLLPYFKKSVTFHPPNERMQEEYGMTYDLEAAYGGSTPIHSSYAPFQWPTQQIEWEAFRDIEGAEYQVEGADGSAYGVFWVPNSIDPSDRTRSYSRRGHWNAVQNRTNYHLLPGHKVSRVATMDGIADSVVIVPRDGEPEESSIGVKKEVVLSAGTIHTPQILQRSGIGPRHVLEAAGIEVQVDLPGVGWNLQDHHVYSVAYNFQTDVEPNQSMLYGNSSFRAWALELWDANRTGPYSQSVGNSAAFLPLSVVSPDNGAAIADTLEAQDPAEYLPEDLDETLVAGFAAQKNAMVRQWRSTKSAILEFPFSGRPGSSVVMLKPASRGTVYLDPVDVEGEPVVDYRALSNPVDLTTNKELLGFARRFFNTPTMAQLTPVERSPGAEVASDEEIEAWLLRTLSPTVVHPTGTAALMPQELGGVVGPDLLVYGVKGISVADNSILTLLPGTHTSSGAYAIGEKAAAIVKSRA